MKLGICAAPIHAVEKENETDEQSGRHIQRQFPQQSQQGNARTKFLLGQNRGKNCRFRELSMDEIQKCWKMPYRQRQKKSQTLV